MRGGLNQERKIAMNCKRATILMSQGMDIKVSLLQKIGLRFHLARCSGCRNFNKQMTFLRKSCQRLTQPNSDTME